MAPKRRSVEDRLVLRTRKSPSGCIEWQGCKLPKGYGTVFNGDRSELAHRMAWRLFVGADPGELMVCHRCDNPSCVNPVHLFLGTGRDNLRDMANKNRQVFQRNPHKAPKGDRNGRAKLTNANAEYIRMKYSLGARQIDLAEEFGVTQSAISKIVLRKTFVSFGDYTKTQLPDGTFEITTPNRKV